VQACRPVDFAAMHGVTAPDKSPPDGALRTRRQWLVLLLAAVSAVTLAHVLDEPAWRLLRDARIYDKDLGRLMRLVGYLPTWLIVAGACWLHDRGTVAWGWRGGLVIVAPTVGGALAEALKMIVRRLRPAADTFGYVFRPFADAPLSTRGLGMPSSHTLVAFAAAAAMSRLFPRTWWIWYLLATGCAVTRVMALGHFLSDTVVAAFLGYVVGVLVSRWGGFGRAVAGPRTDRSS
jgi:membrane-associated phospholipid phosphatase